MPWESEIKPISLRNSVETGNPSHSAVPAYFQSAPSEILCPGIGVPARGGSKSKRDGKCRSGRFSGESLPYLLKADKGQSFTRRFPSPCPPQGCPQSLSRSFKNSSTPSNFFTSAKLIACVASLSTRPVFFHASHKSRMARAQTISDSMGQTTIL
jgi:hypothetical protein